MVAVVYHVLFLEMRFYGDNNTKNAVRVFDINTLMVKRCTKRGKRYVVPTRHLYSGLIESLGNFTFQIASLKTAKRSN
jgi:hypothetical protein